MEILKKIIPLFFPILLTGCYEDFTPKIDVKPVLCLNGLIRAGEKIDITVTHTQLYTDTEPSFTNTKPIVPVADAIVKIYANDKEVSEEYIAQEGDRIKVCAESPTYGYAEAEVTVPYAVPIENVDFNAYVTDIWSYPDQGMVARINFNLKSVVTFKDPAQIVNYYDFDYIGFNPSGEIYNQPQYYDQTDNYYQSGDSNSTDIYNQPTDDKEWDRPIAASLSLGTFKYEAEPIFSEHIGAFETVTGVTSSGFTFFTDRQISGDEYHLHIQFDDMIYYINHNVFNEKWLDCGLVFYLNTISPSLYNWSNYRWQVENGILGELSDIGLAEPVGGYSNVSTGAGVIAAQSTSSYVISLQEFLVKTLSEELNKDSSL